MHQKWRRHMESIQTLIILIASCFLLKIDPFGTVYGCPAFEKKISRGDSLLSFLPGVIQMKQNCITYDDVSEK